MSVVEQFSKHRFQLKGKRSEEALNQLAFKSFLREWCYPNPIDNNGKEICDLLVLFDNQLIVIQLKDIKFTGNEERYIRKAIDAPCKQIRGAERTLFAEGNRIQLTNPHGHSLEFDPSTVNRVLRLVVSVGDGEVPYSAVRDPDGEPIHVFDRSIETVLNELDTISDFSKYLCDLENLVSKSDSFFLVGYRLVDLLGDYIYHGKSFDHLDELDGVYYETGIWEQISSRPEYIAKQKENKQSYFWDHLIEFAHECPGVDYREVARALSRLNRFERRCAAKTFFDAHSQAEQGENGLRRTWQMNGVTYVYLFTPADYERTQRKAQLQDVCTVARHEFRDNSKVIGIATEIGRYVPHSYDYLYMDIPEWSTENQKLAEEQKREHSILTNPISSRASFDEYPSIDRSYPDIADNQTIRRAGRKIGRNDPCPCGSGKKYKKCHGK